MALTQKLFRFGFGKMKKRLYIHVGHYKTGTSALQFLMDLNRAPLAEMGVNYLEFGCHNSKHSRFAFSILREAGVETLMHGYANPASSAELWRDLFAAVRSSKQATCVISSEEFMRIGCFPDAHAQLRTLAAEAHDIDVRVIVYLRPPDSHLRSWYNQLVKMGQPVPAFNQAVCEVIEPVHYNYAQALAPWSDVFGPDAMIVRPYKSEWRGGTGLYSDFLSIFDLPLDTEKLRLPKKDPNPRLQDQVTDLVRLMLCL